MYSLSSASVERYSSSSSTDEAEEPPHCWLAEMMMRTAIDWIFRVCVRVAMRVACGCEGMGTPCGGFGNIAGKQGPKQRKALYFSFVFLCGIKTKQPVGTIASQRNVCTV